MRSESSPLQFHQLTLLVRLECRTRHDVSLLSDERRQELVRCLAELLMQAATWADDEVEEAPDE
jgi:hypothetical protein